MRGYFGIGIFNPKNKENVGTLWRSAHSLGASFMFTIGHRYKFQPGDVTKAWKSIPLFEYESFNEFMKSLPLEGRLIGIEFPADKFLNDFSHPEQAVYLLGSEDNGLPPYVKERCHDLVAITSVRCLNVSVAGSIVMFHRGLK